jgi:hypothetical protein
LLVGHLLYFIQGVISRRDRPGAKSSTITAKEMADKVTTTELEDPVPTNHAFGVQVPSFQFIDELERKHNPESSLRTIVRSNALRSSHLTRRSLNAANTRSTDSNRLRKLAKARDHTETIKSNEETDAGSLSGDRGTTIVVEKHLSVSKARQDSIRERWNVFRPAHHCQSRDEDGTIITASSSNRTFIQFDPHQARQPRQYRKHQAEVMKVQVHEYLNSKVHQSSRPTGEQGYERIRPQSISPQTILGAGRIDPFSSYPIDMAHHMHYLVDHCKTFHFIDISQITTPVRF